jgi:hypothetical protein
LSHLLQQRQSSRTLGQVMKTSDMAVIEDFQSASKKTTQEKN